MNLSVVGSIVSSVVRDIVNAAAALSNTVFDLNILTLSDSHGNSPASTALRNSTATYADHTGVIRAAGIDVPRIQHGRYANGAWQSDDGAGNALHPAATINNVNTLLDLQRYATAQVVVAGGKREHGGRYYTSALGGTTNFNDPLNLSNDGNMLITGSSIKKVSGGNGAWNAAVSSNNNFTGEAYFECSFVSFGSFSMAGLNIDPKTSQNYMGIDYAVYIANDTFIVYESGSLKGNYGVIKVGDKIAVWYKGTTVHYQLNGVDLATTTVAAGLTLALDTSFLNVTSHIDNIIFNSSKVRTPANDVGVTDWVDSGIYHADYGLMQEAAATNLYPSPTAVTTQIITLTAIGDYTLSVGDALDTGSIAITAGTATATGYAAASVGTDVTISATAIGTIVCTLTGTLTRAQLEVGAISSSFTPTSRATELGMLKYSTLVPSFGGNGFPQAQGSMFLSLVMGHDLAQHGGVLDAIISMGGSADLLYAGFTTALTTTDGTTTISQPQPASYYANGDTMQYGVEWDASTALYRLGYRNASAGQPWTWSAWSAYDGAFSDTGVYRFFSSTPSNFPWVVRNNIVQNTTLTTAQWDRYIQP